MSVPRTIHSHSPRSTTHREADDLRAVGFHQTADLHEPLWDDRRVAEFLSISRKTVQSWRIMGCGPEWCKIGHSARYRPAAVREYLDRQTRTSTSQAV